MKSNLKKILIVVVLFLSICCRNLNGQTAKPNLIVIMADDLGYADVGFNGCQDIPTPNIDRIADNGVIFTNGYVTYSVCGPSRAGFMTGRYQQRFGFERNPQYVPDDPNMGLPKEELTLAASLSQVGYTSGVIGKWHLGADISNHPLNRGFDEFYGHLGGGHKYFPEDLTIEDSYSVFNEWKSYQTWILRNHDPEQTDEYLTDEFSNEAVDFVARYKDEPFFLFLSYNAPHTPLEATEKYLSRFPDIADEDRKTYAAMVSAIDDGVGRLLDTLQALNLEENTLIFFLSDNGGAENKNASDNGVLRGQKSDVFEGGFRVPFAMQWIGTIEKQVYELPVSSLDIFATISALSGSPTNQDKPLDGVNLIPHLEGTEASSPHQTIYLRKFDQDRYAVRDGDHKLIVYEDGTNKQLYDLSTDIGEQTNLYSQKPAIYSKLDSMRLAWDEELIHPVFLGLIHRDDVVAENILLSHSDLIIAQDSSFRVQAFVQPSDAVNQTLSWQSSDTSVAKVNNEGSITGMGEGTARIRVKIIDAPAIYSDCMVTVTGSPINSAEKRTLNDVLVVYPNPVNSNQLSIDFNGQIIKNAIIDIYHVSGKREKSLIASSCHKIDIDIHELGQGDYILKIFTGEHIITRKFAVL